MNSGGFWKQPSFSFVLTQFIVILSLVFGALLGYNFSLAEQKCLSEGESSTCKRDVVVLNSPGLFRLFSGIAVNFVVVGLVSFITNGVIESESEKKSEERLQKEKEALQKEKGAFIGDYASTIERSIKETLAEIHVPDEEGKIFEEIFLRINRRTEVFYKRYNASRKVIRYLSKKQNGIEIVDSALRQATQKHTQIASQETLKAGLRKDLSNCLSWIKTSIDELHSAQFDLNERASSIRAVGIEPYKESLQVIKKKLQDIFKEDEHRAEITQIVDDYVEELFSNIKQDWQDRNAGK